MAKFIPIGPAILLLGNPTTALGADMKYLGPSQQVGISNGIRTAHTSTASLGGVPTQGGRAVLAPQPEVQAQLVDAAIDKLHQIIYGSVLATDATAGTTSLGLGDGFATIGEDEEMVLAVIPVSQRALGVDAPNAFWLTNTAGEGLDGFSFGEVQPGRIQNPYNVRFSSGSRTTDLAGTPLPAGFQIGFWGPPPAALTWSLPDLTTLEL